MRKLRKQQDLLSERNDTGDEEQEEEDDTPIQPKPRANVFSAFASLEDGDEDDQDQDQDEPEETQVVESDKPRSEISTSAKKGKKSKKKKTQKEKATAVEPEAQVDEDVDEIDQAIKQLDLKQKVEVGSTGHDSSAHGSSQQLSSLFSVNFHHLKVVNEMRRLFGKEAIDAAQAEGDAGAGEQRGGRRRRVNVDLETLLKGLPGKSISEVLLRRNPFIEGKKHWPRASAGGLTMSTIGNANGDIVEFAFSHDKEYDILEGQFFALVQMHDPLQLVYFLHANPYHVSSLIQVSKVAKQDQNSALSAELCERALFTFGRVTLSSFRKKLEEGKARIDFARPENRQFWLAGYNYIKTLIMKGTYRTALEWIKVFVGISPEDPYAFLNWAHVLAVRAHESQWLIDLCGTDILTDGTDQIGMGDYIEQSMILAKLQQGDRTGAKAALIKGMQRLPWLYSGLFSVLNLDVPRSVWGVVPRGDDEALYTELYLHMAKDLWNNTQATALLVEAGQEADKTDISLLPEAASVSLGTARFIYLDNTPALMAKVPRGMLHCTPNFDFDPLPPPKDQNIFSSKNQELPWIKPEEGNTLSEVIQRIQRDGRAEPIPQEQLRELQEAANDESVPEETRGVLQRFFEWFTRDGALNTANDDPDSPVPRLPGAWEEDDDNDESWGEEDDFMGVDDFGDTMDDDGMNGPEEDDLDSHR
jgi:hypothetical protein